MTSVLLYSRVAPSDRIRVWLGVLGVTQAPTVTWYVDGQLENPVVRRPLSSARAGALLSGDPARAFTGVFEFSGRAPDTKYRVYARVTFADGAVQKKVIDVRTLPVRVPHQSEGWFNVLLGSCFYYDEETRGRIGPIVSDIQKRGRIHMTALLGDQVYLDLPTLKNFDNDKVWLAKKFEDDYVRNWGGPQKKVRGLPFVLAAAPSVSMPDDHEYWNNAPHRATVIQNSLTKKGRKRWRTAARALWDAFQQPYPAKSAEAVIVDVDPVSFFFSDSRTKRKWDRSQCLSPDGMKQLRAWIQTLNQYNRIGVFAIGQSLLAKEAGAVHGRIADWELANYGDYKQIVKELVKAPRDVFLVTGDVHWGRVARVAGPDPRRNCYEVISSPMALVTNPKQTFKKAWSWLSGSDEPFPKHNDAGGLSGAWAPNVFGKTYYPHRIHPQRGDHLSVLSFRRAGQHIETRVSYWPIHKHVRGPIDVGLPYSY